MELVCVGLNHRTAPVEVRERFAVPAGKMGDSAKRLLEIEGLEESVVLSTCNRTEFYLAGEKAELAAAELRRQLAATHGADSDPHWYEHHRISAAKHLCLPTAPRRPLSPSNRLAHSPSASATCS